MRPMPYSVNSVRVSGLAGAGLLAWSLVPAADDVTLRSPPRCQWWVIHCRCAPRRPANPPPMSGLGTRLALVVGSFAAAGAGWFGARRFADDDPSGTAVVSVDLFGCPDGTAEPASIGQVHVGERVWLIGVTDDRWAIVRHPAEPARPAWMPLAAIDTNATKGELPTLSCAAAAELTGEAPPTTAPPTSVGTASTVVLATSTTVVETTSTTSTTIPFDTFPPTVTVTADRAHLYVQSAVPPCDLESSLIVTIVVADPSVPLSIRSIVATWTTPAGVQTSGLSPIGGNRFQLVVPANGPPGGETPLTLIAKGSDGVGNVGEGQLVVSLRDPASFGCTG